MTKLEQLIKELCPNGVEYKKLGNIITFLNGRAYKQTELLSSGKYKVVRVGNFFTNDKWYYSDLELEESKYCINGDLLYCWAASLGPQIWTGDKTIFHYHIWKLEFDETVISKRYLYHFLKKDVDDIYNSLTQSTMPHVSMASMRERIIPVPPLEVQTEIVKILDEYTESVTALQQELEAELTARKKQYEYYRDLLLDFGVHGGTSECEWRTINDIAIKVASGKNKEKKQEGAYPVYGSTGIIAYCDKFEYNKKQILIARVGANAGYVHIADGEYDVSDNTVILDVNDSVIFEYIYYLLVNMNLNRFAKGGGQPLVTAGQIKEIKIPIPPIEEQERIVSILDRFDKLCNDISEGLPAEIEARRKQYEYYRDKLLSFEEMRT